MSKFIYGLRPDQKDNRDLKFTQLKAQQEAQENLPSKVSLREPWDVQDQGNKGKCQSVAFCGIVREDDYTPSPVFHYYNIRKYENQNKPNKRDCGGTLRNTCKVAKKIGIADVKFWADDNKKWLLEPTDAAYKNALEHRNFEYYRIDNANAVQETKEALYLASKTNSKQRVLVGLFVFESFESEETMRTGIVPMPKPEEKLLGGHGVKFVEFNDNGNGFTFPVNWGKDVGDNGYFYVSYEVFGKLLMDAWVVSVVDVVEALD